MSYLGIDIGGSGIKAALVDTRQGGLIGERERLATPQPATPEAVAETVCALVRRFDYQGPIGCGFPAVIRHGIAKSAANIDKSWINVDVESLMADATGCPCTIINDADAAGLAEMRFGAGYERSGTVLVLTLGTGIGSALFYNGMLFPNSELGHLRLKNGIAEKYTSAAVRQQENLSWKAWSKRLNTFFAQVETLFSPDLMILGGGVSRKYEKFFHYLDVDAELLPAQLRNQAGIVGAACHAAEGQS